MQEGGAVSTRSKGGFTHTIDSVSDGLLQVGCTGSCDYIMDTTYRAVVSGICEQVPNIIDYRIEAQVKGFCSTLSEGLSKLQPGIRMDAMYAEILEDEAYFEWAFDNFRFGYSFRGDLSESYWFMVAKDPDEGSIRFKGDFRAGYLPAIKYTLSYIGSYA